MISRHSHQATCCIRLICDFQQPLFAERRKSDYIRLCGSHKLDEAFRVPASANLVASPRRFVMVTDIEQFGFDGRPLERAARTSLRVAQDRNFLNR